MAVPLLLIAEIYHAVDVLGMAHWIQKENSALQTKYRYWQWWMKGDWKMSCLSYKGLASMFNS